MIQSYAFACGFLPDEITIAGGMGDRFDHTLGNVHLIYKALQSNVKAILINENNEIPLIDKFIIKRFSKRNHSCGYTKWLLIGYQVGIKTKPPSYD